MKTDSYSGLSREGFPVPTALIVEDNAMNRKLLRDILEIHFEVSEVSSAEDAQKYLEGQHPDLLLVDLQLPGMDGLSLAKLLQETPATFHIPIVAVSAHAMKENIERSKQVGCIEYVTKPITEDPFAFADRMLRIVEVSKS